MTHSSKRFWRHAVKRFAITALLSCPLLLGSQAFAQWSSNSTLNKAISTAASYQFTPTITSDGADGAIITWTDERNGGNNADIYAQSIDAAGVVQWTVNGVAICTAADNQSEPAITGDGAGGAYITWQDQRLGFNNSDIYAQRIDAAGGVQWPANGVAISTAPNRQQAPTITSDGTGGALIAWEDASGIYAQRINAAGVVSWVPAVHVSSTGRIPDIVGDGAGGAIITWGGSGIGAQRISGAGAVLWAPAGLLMTAFGCLACPTFPAITSDGFGGAIITWFDGRDGANDKIFAQRINAAGVVLWAANGVAMTNVPGYEQLDPTIVSDGAGGAIITWHDDRGGNLGYDVYAQRIDPLGAVQWTAGGAAITTAAYDQWHTSIGGDSAGGAVITWEDDRSTGQGIYDIYAQRINAAGGLQWTANGVAISTAANIQLLNGRYISPTYRPNIVSNRAGCAIITWTDGRNGNNMDIYAQQVNGSGSLGTPCREARKAEMCVTKFNDLDGDGVRGSNEPLLPGWTFIVSGGVGNVTTGPQGGICFGVPAPAAYVVSEVVSTGWTPTTPSPQTVIVSPGQTVNLSFGNTKAGKAEMCLTKFNDLDGDGVRDSNETLLPGWTFMVSGGVGNVTTGPQGGICFAVPAPATYLVSEVVPVGWTPTTPNPQTVTVSPSVSVNLSFGNQRCVRPERTQICLTKFHDKDGDGMQDPNEPGLPGWAFTVTPGGPTVTTASNGTFCFVVPVPGTYAISEVPKFWWKPTVPPTGTHTVTVSGGGVNLKFGNRKKFHWLGATWR
jgi:uncharacterized protein (DUF2141 family)